MKRRRVVETSELIRLYNSGLVLREIAAETGITYQAVHDRLKRAGFRMYHTAYEAKKRQPLEPAAVRRLYVQERLSLVVTASRLGVGTHRLKAQLRLQGIKIRKPGGGARRSMFADLKVGRAIEVQRVNECDPRAHYYRSAAKLGFKFRINKLGGGRWRVTRIM